MKPAPVRLRDRGSGAPDAVRGLLDEGAAELPDAADLARLAARLPIGTPPPLAPAAASSAIVGPAAGLAIALVAIGAALWHNAATAPPAPSPLATAPSATAAAAAEGAPPDAPAVPASPAHAEPSPPEAPAAPTAKVATKREPETAAPASSAAGEGEPEVELLQRAQAALAADPSRALGLAREHERRFPRGALGQEREVVVVGALVALGRVPEAQARAARFVERFPRSAYRRRIEALVPGPRIAP